MLKRQWFITQWIQKSQSDWSSAVYEQVLELWNSEYRGTPTTPQSSFATHLPIEDSVHNRLREYKRLKVTSTSTSTENDALVTEFN
jgi:hypothetical protein